MRAIWSLGLLLLLSTSTWAADPPKALVIDKDKKTLIIDAKIAPRKLPHLSESYPIEVIATFAHPKGKKAHETVVVIDETVKPSDIHKALESLGLKPGKPILGESPTPAEGPELTIALEIPDPAGPRKLTIDKVLVDIKSNKPLPKGVKFHFTGSVMTQPDPDKNEKFYGADLTGTFIAIYPVTNETVIQTSLTSKEEKYLKLDIAKNVLPKEGTPVKLLITAK